MLKNALDGMQCSIRALLDMLLRHGVSKATIQELSRQTQLLNHHSTAGSSVNHNLHILHVLERAQEYAKCIFDDNGRGGTPTNDGSTVFAMLLVVAWETACRYIQLQYRQAHQQYQSVRYYCKHRQGGGKYLDRESTSSNSSAVSANSSTTSCHLDVEERDANCDRTTMTTTHNFFHNHATTVKIALHLKVQLAEQCCTAQKGLIVAETWQRQLS